MDPMIYSRIMFLKENRAKTINKRKMNILSLNLGFIVVQEYFREPLDGESCCTALHHNLE